MVVKTLRPGRFYGGSLPRPWVYSDVKYSDERVDPPVSVNDPLLAWANEAHWSMGGLSFDRTRLMGKIEGNVEKLRKEKEEKFLKKNPKIETPIAKYKGKGGKGIRTREVDNSPPPAPKSRKLRLRSRVVDVEDEDEEDEEEAAIEAGRKRRRLVRKLGDEFEFVADDKVKEKGKVEDLSVGSRKRMTRRRNMVLMNDGEESDVEKEVVTVKETETRSSPRLKK